MNILILGDVMGPSGREALKLNLKNIISQKLRPRMAELFEENN